jgi:gas vesicle protein
MGKSGKVIIAFVAGTLIGAGLGILLAPDKGEITRRKIKTKIDDIGDKANEQYSKVKKNFVKEEPKE